MLPFPMSLTLILRLPSPPLPSPPLLRFSAPSATSVLNPLYPFTPSLEGSLPRVSRLTFLYLFSFHTLPHCFPQRPHHNSFGINRLRTVFISTEGGTPCPSSKRKK